MPERDAEAGAVGDLEADEGAQGAVSGFRAGVEVETAQAAEAGHVVGAGRPRREGRRAVDAAAALRPNSYSKRARPPTRKQVSVPGM